MKLQTKSRDDLEVNITPLIDVVFLLLIFFMLTASFQQETRLKVDLPSSSIEPQKKLEDPLEIVVAADGEIVLVGEDGIKYSWSESLKVLSHEGSSRGNIVGLKIYADKSAPTGSIVEVMDMAQQLGISSVSIMTERSGK
ncbi:MAG: biopolymer transporter ExbD [Thiotrichales bacterium]|jgi:biopolymer transport protein ExbD|nr:biopolymer transporter ExbD [Thiotrichales bacterium]MBT3613027.1 biopolymer transporter ExbD [Thiotrichales bacterium]MBT3751929.1 biopolymer transporter ExbD [Thiotrichales bacterium]MBT3836749.1 biopolymer transporter ExbD [Thiotrichales bacterium]MBT4151723.1 biopolymer transporter ExbD [Thiotrichales bacterium]